MVKGRNQHKTRGRNGRTKKKEDNKRKEAANKNGNTSQTWRDWQAKIWQKENAKKSSAAQNYEMSWRKHSAKQQNERRMPRGKACKAEKADEGPKNGAKKTMPLSWAKWEAQEVQWETISWPKYRTGCLI